MRLQDIFTPDRIILDLQSREKNGVFRELTDRVAESYGIREKEKVLEAELFVRYETPKTVQEPSCE